MFALSPPISPPMNQIDPLLMLSNSVEGCLQLFEKCYKLNYNYCCDYAISTPPLQPQDSTPWSSDGILWPKFILSSLCYCVCGVGNEETAGL